MTVIMRIRHGMRGDHGQRSDFAAPQVIRDQLDDMISPLDGKPQTSKRAYYKQVRDAGCEINDKATVKDSNRPDTVAPDLRDDIMQAIANPMKNAEAENFIE